MSSVRHLAVPELNDHLICTLCNGYLVDATTITECLHSFCRSCLVRYFDLNNTCPKCRTQVHKTRPLLNIRPDKTLQDLVYKLIPGLFTAEMERRREFFAEHPDHLPDPNCPNASELRGDIYEDRFKHVEDEKISIILQHYKRDPDDNNVLVLEEKFLVSKTADRRYLLCPGGLPVDHLKKFVRHKFGLEDTMKVEIFHSDEVLNDNFTLSDVAELYSWRRMAPLKLYYFVHVRPHVTVLPVPRPPVTLHVEKPKPKKNIIVPKKKAKRLRANSTVTKTTLVNGVKDILQNGANDSVVVTTTTTVSPQLPPIGGKMTASSTEQCRAGSDSSPAANISVETICDNLESSDNALTSDHQSQGQEVKDGSRSPTNNNESAVSSPCKNCPTSGGACAHAHKSKLRVSLVAKNLTRQLSETSSSGSESESPESGQSSGTEESSDPGEGSSDPDDSICSSPGGNTCDETIKVGFNIRKVVAPNFSGVLKIPIVQRKIMSPTQLGGVVKAHAKPEIRSPSSELSSSSPEVPPKPAAVPTVDTSTGGDKERSESPVQEAAARRDKLTEPAAQETKSADPTPSPPPVSRIVNDKCETVAMETVVAASPTPSKQNGEEEGTDDEVFSMVIKKEKDDELEIQLTIDSSPKPKEVTAKSCVENTANGTSSSSDKAVADRVQGVSNGVADVVEVPRDLSKKPKLKSTSPAPIVPRARPPPVRPATTSLPAAITPTTPVNGSTRTAPATTKKQATSVAPANTVASTKPSIVRPKKSVSAHGGSPVFTSPKSPSRSPKRILPKGPCGVMAHGCVPGKRPSPPGKTSPPKRVRLNVCHGLQNVQNSAAMTTSAMMPLTPNIAHSGHPVYMTSVPHVMPSLTYGRHIHPAFYLHQPLPPPVPGYDAPLELTTKRRDS